MKFNFGGGGPYSQHSDQLSRVCAKAKELWKITTTSQSRSTKKHDSSVSPTGQYGQSGICFETRFVSRG